MNGSSYARNGPPTRMVEEEEDDSDFIPPVVSICTIGEACLTGGITSGIPYSQLYTCMNDDH